MRKSRYNQRSYWQMLLRERNMDWKNIFQGMPLRGSTCLMHLVFKSQGVTSLDHWMIVPNPYAAVGFLKYIYLPMVYADWLSKDLGPGLIKLEGESVELVFRAFEAHEQFGDGEEIPLMRQYLKDLDLIWDAPEVEVYDKLQLLNYEMDQTFLVDLEQFFYYDIFVWPRQVNGVLDVCALWPITVDQALGLPENLSVAHWQDGAFWTFDKAFLQRKFVDFLNQYANSEV